MGSNPMEYSGAAVVAMAGKDCVAIASDRRFGAQFQTISMDFQKVFRMHDRLYVGLNGLPTDIQTIAKTLEFRLKMYSMREERDMKPATFTQMLSSMLYEKRFGPYFAEPVVAGLEADGKPYIAAMDLIGAPVFAKDFVVAGSCSENLYGMAESLYRPDLGPEDLFETISQVLLSAVDRDAMSGWGAVVHVITPEGVTTRELKARMD